MPSDNEDSGPPAMAPPPLPPDYSGSTPTHTASNGASATSTSNMGWSAPAAAAAPAPSTAANQPDDDDWGWTGMGGGTNTAAAASTSAAPSAGNTAQSGWNANDYNQAGSASDKSNMGANTNQVKGSLLVVVFFFACMD